MLKESIEKVYDKFMLEFFRGIFSMVKEREGSLSAMEAFSVEVIHSLGEPTIGQFADFLNISQSNATYKVNSLMRKGYIVKENSTTDRREYHLKLADKYYQYTNPMRENIGKLCNRLERKLSSEELVKLEALLHEVEDSLEPGTAE
jgi:DNA-binding MarR family transcriptional regulator